MTAYRNTILAGAVFLCLLQSALPAAAQLGIDLNLKKPQEFENRQLGYEKGAKRKFGITRRFFQNTYSHYNYFFNANNRLNEVLTRAKQAHVDDYSKLISFYNYDLATTARDSMELDSVSYKSQTGIVLHDLRSDWADNFYLLWGITYYLKQHLDSAQNMFQFINYAFAERKEDGSFKAIGSRMDGNNAMSISTVEKNTLSKRMFTTPPSRNDALIWQIRTLLVQGQYGKASGLIQALKRDENFPDRLQDDLAEVQALAFYQQEQWDSTAYYLEKALSNAPTQQEEARWEYLLAQLYEKTGHYSESVGWYGRAMHHTTDPILDIYARLAEVRVNKDSAGATIEKNVATLLKMAKRDKYADYRGIIYYMAAQMELERNNITGALEHLKNSAKYKSPDVIMNNKVFIQLAELSFQQKLYRQATHFYDSVSTDDPTITDVNVLISRKSLLARLADNIEIVERQDSLRKLAALPEDERKDMVKKLARQLRRQQGLKEEGIMTTGGLPAKNEPANLFQESTKGEWYFYNSSLRQKGQNDFRAKWGSRPNADNWRRSSAILSVNNRQSNDQPGDATQSKEEAPAEITFESLYEKIPLNPEAIKKSDDSIQVALLNQGLIYIKELDDCNAGTAALEELRRRYPDYNGLAEADLNLYYCYSINGEAAKAATIKQELNNRFPKSNETVIVNTGKNPFAEGPQKEATQVYEKIYEQFIEGDFGNAVEAKRKADSIYNRNYWNPQLMYIESVYYIKQRQDSSAKEVLKKMIAQFGGTDMAAKATNLLDVLNRREQIENELRNLDIQRPTEDTIAYDPIVKQPVRIDTARQLIGALPTNIQKPVVGEEKKISRPDAQPNVGSGSFTFDPGAQHYVMIILNKVDPVYVNEAKNAFARYNQSTYTTKPMQATLSDFDADNRLLLLSPFANLDEALQYIAVTKPKAASQIIPWLKGGKYSFSVISIKNLESLQFFKDLQEYTQFISAQLPGKL